MNSPAPSKDDRIHPALICVVIIMAGVPLVLTSMFLFGKLYGAIAFVAILSICAAGTVYWQRLKRTRPELTRRIEKTVSGGEPSKDPRQMARWMR